MGLMNTVTECLKYFNRICNKDILKLGRGLFTHATLGEIIRILSFYLRLAGHKLVRVVVDLKETILKTFTIWC